MFTQDELLELLRGGQDPTELANQFADLLNAAVKAKQEEEAAAARNQKEEADAKLLFQHFKDFMNMYMPELWDYLFPHLPDMKYTDIKKMLYGAMEETKNAMKMYDNFQFLEDIPTPKNKAKEEAPTEGKKKTDDELIADWLREMGFSIDEPEK